MTTLMLAILAAWFVALLLGPAIYAAMGLAGFAFLFLSGIPGIVGNLESVSYRFYRG